MKIAVVGIGALGSHVVQLLRNCEAEIRVIDFDKVEQRNVASQFHARNHVGKKKTQSLSQTMQFLFNRKLDTIPHKLTSDNVEELLGGGIGLILDCLDNGEARRLVQAFAKKNNVPCLHGALAADGVFGQAVWTEDFKIDDAPSDGAATCEDGEHLPFISVVASLIAFAATQYLSTKDNTKPLRVGFQISPGGVIKV